MIHLFSTIYATYYDTMQPSSTDYVFIGTEKKKNYVESTVSKRMGRFFDLNFDFNAVMTDLKQKIDSGESEKIIVYLDKDLFGIFVTKWLRTVYKQASDETFVQIYKLYRKSELTKSLWVETYEEDTYEKLNFGDSVDTYWPELPDLTLVGFNVFNYDLVSNCGIEHVISNTILGNSNYRDILESKVGMIYDRALAHNIFRARLAFDSWALSTKDIGSYTNLFDEIEAKYPAISATFVESRRSTTLLGDVLAICAEINELENEHLNKDLLVINDIIALGRLHTTEEMIDDILGDNKLFLLNCMAEHSKMNPFIISMAKLVKDTEAKDQFLAFVY